ncbi:MAG: hypothetical protein JSW71_16020 [Gemmatimonadota bacterium]|nr:MAG: hypothetical protein JSW71_16020 [Gemmatimonadota bacterium]
MSKTIRVTVFRTANVHVDVKLRSPGWFAEVRVWRGGRWPDLQATFVARVRGWLPWFSLRRQVGRAVEYVNQFEELRLSKQEVADKVAVALLLISEEAASLAVRRRS